MPKATGPTPPPAECEANCAHHRPVQLRAWLLTRVFDPGLEHCPNCGGEPARQSLDSCTLFSATLAPAQHAMQLLGRPEDTAGSTCRRPLRPSS